MGLYASFTPQDLGYPLDITKIFLGEELMVEVDYGEALAAAVDTFLDVATDLVPVDTGYLQSTISASSDGMSASFEASAEYAQYPEYGTWCQQEQPYFRPALDEALGVFREMAGEAYDWAQEEMQNLMEDVMAAAEEAAMAMTGSNGFGSYLMGAAMGAAVLFLMMPLLMPLYGIMETISSAFSYNDNFGSASVSADSLTTIT